MASAHHFHVDGHWIPCQPGCELGSLGIRHLLVLGESPGQPSKKLLLRYNVWPQANAPAGTPALPLTLGVLSKSEKLSLRPVAGKKYQECFTKEDGKQRTQTPQVLQQDVTGLVSLRQAIVQTLERGEPQRVWKLFYNACEALDRLGKAAEARGQVPLQCPDSLAVGRNNEIVPLDAEIRVFPPIPPGSEAGSLYAVWFGAPGINGVADARSAALLHADALLRYFRHVLGGVQQMGGSRAAQAAVVLGQSQEVPAGKDLSELEDFLGSKSTDWNIWVEDEEPAPVGAVTSKRPSGFPPALPRQRSLLLRVSLWANLVLVVVIIILFFLWRNKAAQAQPAHAGSGSPLRTGEESREPGHSASSLHFSSYCVVFPTQGTISDKVKAALDKMHLGKVIELKRNADDDSQRLQTKREETIKSLKEPARLEQLLTRLAGEHSVSFKGFTATEPKESLRAVIERGGLFTITTSSGKQHGSLLQANGLEKVLRQAGLENDREAIDVLESLTAAILEYASLKDALSLAKGRDAFLLMVEPTDAAHAKLRFHLLSRLDQPVFISHPLTELFDAVDPTADTGGGSAAYELRLDRPCYWREAGMKDRMGVDFRRNNSNQQMKWVHYDARQIIHWKPIPLTKIVGRPSNVTTFDIAIPTGDKVVVFQNQDIFFGKTKNEVVEQARNHIRDDLKLNNRASEDDFVSVRFQDGQYTGTLLYSFLADQIPTMPSEYLLIMTKDDFKKRMDAENGMLGGP